MVSRLSDDLSFLDATATADAVRNGHVSPAEVVDAAITRVEKLNPELNAVIHDRFDAARREAAEVRATSGPLAGVPIVIKDLHGLIAGEPYHGGCQAAKNAGYRATETSVFIERLRDAGAVVVGKTNTPEFGLYPATEPLAYGPTRNPYDTTRSTGGSSGGSGAAVASGMVPVGHANDGGGSIRVPASECGLVGLKPTRGRVTQWPEGAEVWGGLNAEGVVTRTVRDTALLLDVMAGPAPGDIHTPPAWTRPLRDERGGDATKLRIGVCTTSPDGQTPVQPDVVAAVDATALLLESLGHRVARDAYPSALVNPDLVNAFLPCYGTWAQRDLETWGARLGRDGALGEQDVEPGTWAISQLGRDTTATHYAACVETLQHMSRAVQQWWDDFDLLLTPTIPEEPPPLGQFGSPDNPLAGVFRSAAIVPFTIPFNVTGQPAMSLPLHTNAAGLPVGVQLVAAFAREDILIRVGLQLEEAHPWQSRRPAISA